MTEARGINPIIPKLKGVIIYKDSLYAIDYFLRSMSLKL